MKTKLNLIPISLLAALFVALAGTAQASLPINFNFNFNGSNSVQVSWNAYPGKSYVLQTTTNLAGTWSSSATLVATSNSLAFSFPTTAKAQFFKVVKLDTEGPQVSPISPLDGAIAVGRQSPVQVGLTDATGVNSNSIVLTVGTNAAISLPNPQLAYVGGTLTYTPATNVFLGTNGQIVTASVSVADTLGNVTTNFTWSFQIALPSVPGTNILYIPGSSGLVLTSTNGSNYTFSYPGSFPGLTAGEVLVNTNLNTGYTVTVLSFTNYPASHNVVVLTTSDDTGRNAPAWQYFLGEFHPVGWPGKRRRRVRPQRRDHTAGTEAKFCASGHRQSPRHALPRRQCAD